MPAQIHEAPTLALSMLMVAVAADGTRIIGTPPLLRADEDCCFPACSPLCLLGRPVAGGLHR